jgi:hypothetical protein
MPDSLFWFGLNQGETIWQAFRHENGLGFYFGVSIMSYILGHIVSTLSLLLLEGKYSPFRCLFSSDNHEFDSASRILFGKIYDECDRQVVVYCQKNNPDAYDTAFWFLFTHEISRSIGFLFLSLSVLLVPMLMITHEEMQPCCIILFALLLFAIACIMLYNHRRFKRYYHQQLGAELLRSEKVQTELKKQKENPHED